MKDIQELKLAFIGASHWHAPLYFPAVGSAGLRVVAVSDPNEVIAKKCASQLGGKAYINPMRLLDTEKPDFVFAFDIHSRMPAQAMALIERNIPFSIEKPLGVCAQDVRDVKKTADAGDIFCAIPLIWRNSQLLRDLKENHSPDDFVNLSFTFNAGPPSRYINPSPWMLKAETAGSGCMTNLGIHFIDMALFLTDSTNADVLGSTFHYMNGYDVEDYAVTLFKLPNGATVSLQTGYAYPMTEDSKRDNHWCFTTKAGYYTIRDNAMEVRRMGEPSKTLEYNTDTDPYYEVYTKQTLEAYVAGKKPAAGLDEMLNARIVLDQIISKGKEC